MQTPNTAIIETLERMLDTHCNPDDLSEAERTWPQTLWKVLDDSELPRTWVAESLGGAGAGWSDGLAVIRVAARYAAPVPLAETLMTGYVLAKYGVTVPTGALNISSRLPHESIECGADGTFSGQLGRVPFGRHLSALVVLTTVAPQPTLAVLPQERLHVVPGEGLAGEPLDAVTFSGAEPSVTVGVDASTVESVRKLGATIRCFQMAGALEHVLSRSIEYAQERSQFGRKISKFQAVQHNLAELAGETSAAAAAANAAGSSIENHGVESEQSFVAVASAKIRCGQAASRGAAIAHQVHGAMGFAREYPLHHYSRRLWAWRDDFGTETEWAEELGQLVADKGPDALWPLLTSI
jgi:acyl-CoA dehydrogenase